MSESEARAFIASLAFVLVSAIAALAWGQIALNYLFGIWLLFVTFTGVGRDDLRTLRRRTMHALATLRRRHDNELLEVWLAVNEKPAAEYVPDEEWAPAVAEEEDITIWEPDPEPTTAPIRMPQPLGPPTVPDMKAASKVAPLPKSGIADDWERQRDRILAEADAEILEISQRQRT